VFGEGDVDLVFIPGWASNVENIWTLPEFAEFARELAKFARVILLDRRGTGLSDPVPDPPTFEERMDDVRAVLDAAGITSPDPKKFPYRNVRRPIWPLDMD